VSVSDIGDKILNYRGIQQERGKDLPPQRTSDASFGPTSDNARTASLNPARLTDIGMP
jgi:hypothetical protein